MNRITKKLKKVKNFFKKQTASLKKIGTEEKLDKLYEARLDRGLTVLGIKEKSCGFYRYYYNRWSDSAKESFKKALFEEAKKIGKEKEYDQALKTAMSTRIPHSKKTRWIWLASIILLGLLFSLLASYRNTSQDVPNPSNAVNQATEDSQPTVCQNTWEMRLSDYTDNRWFANGVIEIKDANNPEDARKAVNAWLDGVKRDPNLLIGASKYFLGRDVDKTTLFNSDNCATDLTVQLVSEIELNIAQAKSITPEDAPVNGYNSGVENDSVVGSQFAGISGDRKSIHISLPNGKDLWILARCGNLVTVHKPHIQYGKTDEHKKHEHKKHIEKKKPEIKPKPRPKPKPTPKSSNPKDYKKPGDDNKKDSGTGTKPKATVSTPAESSPPEVTTSKTGSEGIVDTPTNKPGSETGTTAKDATPAPTKSSTPKPPNEGGSNDGKVTD